jgi:Bacterial low temperature requirement A protein (LtrA)
MERRKRPSRWVEPPRLRTADGEADELHATWLELFFDLVFVVAVAELATQLEASTFGARSVASPAVPGMRDICRSVADQLPRFVSATLRNASRRSVAPAASSSGAHPPER